MAGEFKKEKEKNKEKDEVRKKSQIALREEEILAFWKEKKIFEKSLEKPAQKGDFVFYDGPPFATGTPHYGHVLPGTMKDVIPRFRTMWGYHVPRKWGWDCHGLPIENLVEKELGLKNKKEIEDLGIKTFNEKARSVVLRYDHEWKEIVPRTGRFVDMDSAYLTMDWKYSESIWWSFKTLHNKGLVYQGFKSMMLCPRCETTLSNFEVTQGYKDITDISVYVKFELLDEAPLCQGSAGQARTFVLAWTTTPWTLPGNVALAVGKDIDYVEVLIGEEKYILAKERLSVLKDAEYKIVREIKGKDLVGKKYKPVFDYYVDSDLKNKENAWKIVSADFVTTTDGTGVVHIAPAFGEDDYNLSLKEKLPFIQHVASDGTFKKEVADFAGQPVKPIDTKEEPNAHQKADIEIIKYLAGKGTLFAKEKLVHSYPHCWRCDTPLLNYATSSWFVEVSKFKDKLVGENKKVKWVPEEIGDGRFGKWLENARDWAISRSRYWGAPLPVWHCKECGKMEFIGSVKDIRTRTKRNNYYVVRHGEADHNVANVLSSSPKNPHHLTERGREQVSLSSEVLKDKKIDLIIASPLVRTRETADIIIEQIAFKGEVIIDDRLREFDFGDYNLKNFELYHNYFSSVSERFAKRLPNGECINDVRKRIGEFLYDIDRKYEGKNIVFVTHDGPASILFAVVEGADEKRIVELWGLDHDFLGLGQEHNLDFAYIPHNDMYELDLHRPYIDDVSFACACGKTMHRVPEVFDTWYESGSMPYASVHYPFENKKLFEEGGRFPADFIAEGQDQTRGWFYSLLVLSTALFGQSPYKNVIVNGTILAEDGQKMAKRLKNYPEVTHVLDTYGADALRYYLLSSPVVKAEDVAFSEKGVDEVVKKIVMRLGNVSTFYKMYEDASVPCERPDSKNVLDLWILARLDEITSEMTSALLKYEIDRGARPIMDFVDDLSTWYLRRSRDRFKGDNPEDKNQALQTTRFVLREFSKLMAPFMPFVAEDVYLKTKTENDSESVHLADWPTAEKADEKIIGMMQMTRNIVEIALSLRAESKMKVRQPLASLTLDSKKYPIGREFLELIKDEVNVKEIIFAEVSGEKNMSLDTALTPELKAEGDARDFIRSVQELRKTMKLSPNDAVTLVVSTDESGTALVKKFEKNISETANVKAIVFENTGGEKFQIGDMTFDIELKTS